MPRLVRVALVSLRDLVATAGPFTVTVPLSYADELYALRQHIDLVRARLQKT